MEKNISHIAGELKKDIKDNAPKVAKSLIDFASNYAVEKKLKYDAVLLNRNFTKANEAELKIELQSKMLQLVDSIVEDFVENGQTEEARVTKQIIEKLEAHFAQQKTPNDVVFACEGLGKTYRKTNFSLTDIDLRLRLGEVTSVVGENGNGKTTLFRIIVGELAHQEGKLTYPLFKEGIQKKVRWRKVLQHIAYVPQELPAWHGSLMENLQFEAAIRGIRGKDNEREVAYIIQRMGLEEHLNKKWNQLSGGFKLRFSLAKALVWKPKMLVIDEPLANLDIKTQLIVLKDLRNLANSFRYPIAVLLSSQHLHEIEAVSDNILFLKNGESAFYGKKEDLGASRTYNTFELDCKIPLNELKESLSDFPYLKLYHNGISYTLTTSLDVSPKEVLQYLLERDIEILYFRNISQSVKQLFEL